MIKLDHMPLNNIIVNSPYGKRNLTVNNNYYWWHNGVDLKANINTPIFAAAGGKVMAAKYNNSYGYYIVIDHGKFGTLYAHLSLYNVKENGTVKAGELLGYSGNTGDTTGAHLHFEIRLCGYDKFWDRAYCDSNVFMNTTDPMLFIDDYMKRQQELTVDEAIKIVQLSAGLEDKTMDYMAKYYKYGEDLVKKLAKTII